MCGWQKITLVWFFVCFCKKLRFLVQFFTKFTAVLFFFLVWFLHSSVNAIFHLCLYGITLEMMYFSAELVQLIASRSDSELEVQRYSMKKNTLTVDPVMLEDEL